LSFACLGAVLSALQLRMYCIQPLLCSYHISRGYRRSICSAFDAAAAVVVQVTDGASAVLMMTRREALNRGLPVLGIFRSFSAVGVDPAIMGVGPAVAIPAAVAQVRHAFIVCKGMHGRIWLVWGSSGCGPSHYECGPCCRHPSSCRTGEASHGVASACGRRMLACALLGRFRRPVWCPSSSMDASCVRLAQSSVRTSCGCHAVL
jgi:hypothetical protein